MRSFLIFISFIILSSCKSRSHKEYNTEIKYSGTGYNKLSLFVYSTVQKDSLNSIVTKDTLGLFSSPYLDLDSQYAMQWEFLTKNSSGYQLIESKYCREFTGIRIDSSELFIHPARGCYNILQFCPYPFFYNNKKIGDTWEWSFKIGPLWADSVYPIKTAENFKTTYTYRGTATLNTVLGNLFCYNIIAISTSKFGKSYASYYLNNNLGLVNFKIKTINKHTFAFNLISVIRNEDSIRFNKSFVSQFGNGNEVNILKILNHYDNDTIK